MPKRFGAFLLGAAFLSFLLPSKAEPRRVPAPRAPERKRLYALVQVKPTAIVLAVSDSRADLEAEMQELNETWNHWDLRSERHRYEIQSVCLLQTGRDPIRRAAASSGPHEVSGT